MMPALPKFGPTQGELMYRAAILRHRIGVVIRIIAFLCLIAVTISMVKMAFT